MSSATSTFLHIGNFQDLDPDESNDTVDNPSPIFRPFTYDDMTTTQVVQNDANGDGRVQENDNGQTADTFTYDVGDGSTTSALDNAARYRVNYVDETDTVRHTFVSVYQTENGDVFVKFPNGLQIKSMEIVEKVGDGYSAITHGTSSSSRAVCFASGTYIETPVGLRRIESLRVGDRVMTLDHGSRPIRWVHHTDEPLLAVERDQKPVLIQKGALGRNRPVRDLIVSPQHRILVGGSGQLDGFLGSDALAPAKALIGLPGVRHMQGKHAMTWVHFACDQHEIVFANGCMSESLLLGAMVLKGLSQTQVQVLVDMFGSEGQRVLPLNGPTVRPCLTSQEVLKQLTAMPVGYARTAGEAAVL